jgi:hypothetical protein
MDNRRRQLKNALRGWKNFLRARSRRLRIKRKLAGLNRHQANVKKYAIRIGRVYKAPRIKPFARKLSPKPDFPENIKFLASVPESFSKNHYSSDDDGYFYLPECFSLIERYQESFDFLKRLFVVLYKAKVDKVTLDYSKCKRIDVDASICMDILLAEFIHYINQCRKRGHNIIPDGINPVNFENKDIMKVLFSIGAYRNLKGLSIKYKDVEALPVLINSKKYPDVWERSEVHLTNIVEYIKKCLQHFDRELTSESESEFYKVIGEVMSNAEEHATMPNRFAIGFFQETHNPDGDFGVFNFSIFNFGDTIYQTFKSPNCANPKAVSQMNDLSEDYTKKGWFTKAEFEEETLWTLYALQEGVTSKAKKRGNGSIQFIENFFKLKGDDENDNISKLAIVSGNTRVLFDGTYKVTEKPNPLVGKRPYKMITFNESGDIRDKPDKNFVTFAPHFFPGTLISARILIKFKNTNAETDGQQGV